MRTTIDRLGRVVVPKAIRERLRLLGGETIDIDERNGVVEIRVAPTDVHVEETAEGPVATPTRPMPPLTDDIVRDTIERTRR
ncbi:MAG: AbrB/MazE/SpoVT family DNA-binding domain-containing protein [Actinomycetota bacterium]